MRSLNTLLRGARGAAWRPVYRPFSQPPYRGRYPFMAPRGSSLSTNVLLPVVSTGKYLSLRAPAASKSTLSLYEDRRLWHPLGKSAFPKSKTESFPVITHRGYPHTPHGEPLKLVPSKTDPSGWRYITDRPGVLDKARLSPGYGFANPWKVIICLKRKMRREVMNALGYAGKTGFKKPTYTQYSYVRCY